MGLRKFLAKIVGVVAFFVLVMVLIGWTIKKRIQDRRAERIKRTSFLYYRTG
jgi:hypothetical protein